MEADYVPLPGKASLFRQADAIPGGVPGGDLNLRAVGDIVFLVF